MRRTLRIVYATLFVLVAAACASPTLPLPPPAIPSVVPAGDGQVTLSSEHGVEPNAIVILYNHNDSLPREKRVAGTLADPEGTWDQTIYAAPMDTIDVSQEFGTMRSATTTFQIPSLPDAGARPGPDAGTPDAGDAGH